MWFEKNENKQKEAGVGSFDKKRKKWKDTENIKNISYDSNETIFIQFDKVVGCKS